VEAEPAQKDAENGTSDPYASPAGIKEELDTVRKSARVGTGYFGDAEIEGDIYLGAEMSGEGRKAELHMLGESITGRFELEAPHRVGELSTPRETTEKERKEEGGQGYLAKSEWHAELEPELEPESWLELGED